MDHPAATPTDEGTPAGPTRRRVLTLGSAGIAFSTLLAACGSVNTGAGAGASSGATTTTVAKASSGDIAVLRTLSSIEALLVKVYQAAGDANVVKSTAAADAVKAFLTHHQQHLLLVQRATESGGGSVMSDPNPVVLAKIQAQLVSLRTEQDVLSLAYEVEVLAAQTYQAAVGAMDSGTYYEQFMQIAGSEASHLALLAVVASPALSATGTPDGAFGATDKAISAGTGV